MTEEKPTVVLVHGAFADSSSWDGVIERLQAESVDVVAVANPLRTLSGDAAYVRDVIAGLGRPVVLAGHSYAGMVITEAAADNDSVVGLVYVCAFAPTHGESAFALSMLFPGSTLGDALRAYPVSTGGNELAIRPERYHAQFAADLQVAQAAVMSATQRPATETALSEGLPTDTPAWEQIPSWFVIGVEDRNIPAALQRFEAERAGPAVSAKSLAAHTRSPCPALTWSPRRSWTPSTRPGNASPRRPRRRPCTARMVPSELRRRLRTIAVPVHWTFLLGTVSAACLTVLVVTGIFLLFFYDPSGQQVVYHGSYVPLQGVPMSRALDSTLHLSFDVRAGLLMRQAHHWAALVLPASLMLQMLSIFFTGGFRRPRQRAWLLLCAVFLVTLIGGWSGYGLPDDLLAGTGQRIVEGITLGLPLVGTRVTRLLFGGEFPGDIVTRLYWIHIVLVPVGLLPLIALRRRILHRRGPTQFPGPGRTEDTVVGIPWTTAAVRSAGLFLLTVAVLLVMAATVTIAPIWLNGPASPSDASNGSQPDWYTSFLDGALRLVPPNWEITGLGGTWTLALLLPQAVIGLFLAIIVAWPYLEERVTGDRREHNLLDRPRDVPRRTATGVAGLAFYATLWAAAASDVTATHLKIPFETQVVVLRVCLAAAPVVGYVVTSWICVGLQDRDRVLVEHGVETGQVVRLPGGGFTEVRRPLTAEDRWTPLAPQVTVTARPRLRSDEEELETTSASADKQGGL